MYIVKIESVEERREKLFHVERGSRTRKKKQVVFLMQMCYVYLFKKVN